MLRGVLEAQAPPKQNATDTINTLSSRLVNATLLEDRRGAILGLRSFAKQYPASVASGALRGLISALTKDVEDVDTEKVVLETLLMLFNPNKNSPEADDDIALWLADEFSQRQDNITTLLDLLETPDFYSRLYALQLLSAICAARPERTQECILSAPLGTTKLVATLDDSREAVRSAGLVLLNDVTQSSPELQKLVAFENAFERIFRLIKAEGSLARGGIVVQDCLSLLANLLDLNPSNQSLFRETGFVGRLSRLLSEDSQDAQKNVEDLSGNPTRDKNLWGLLAVLRMFLVPDNKGTQANQVAFEKNGLLQLVLNMGFDPSVGVPVRAEALHTCSDMVRGNGKIQERFAHNKVVSPLDVPTAGESQKQSSNVYIIDALLNMTLSVPTMSMFDIRVAASECIQAYFYNHTTIRHHFLRRAIEGHTTGDDETGNILSILISGPRSYQSGDPYRLWFAARIAFELLYEDADAKNMTMKIAEGDAASGEEVVTCIQAMTGNLLISLQSGDDDRISVGYLMLLCGWLFDDADAVNDFLSEGSVIQSLIQATSKSGKGLELVQGLCVVLLGIVYEFSTKDSPIPRRTLQPLLTSGLGRESYTAKLRKLRQHPIIRDFEVLPQNLSSAQPGGLPEVYFEQAFVNFIKDNFSRLIRAIDRDPQIEVARVHEGVDRDLVDSLRSQIEDRKQAIQKAESDFLALERRLGQEQADHRRSQETSKAELGRIRSINEALQKGHEADIDKSDAEHRKIIQNIQQDYRYQMEGMERQIQQVSADAAMRAETTAAQHRSELDLLEGKLKKMEASAGNSREITERLQRANNEVLETLRQRDVQMDALKITVQQYEAQLNELKGDLSQSETQLISLKERLVHRDAQVDALETERQQRESDLESQSASISHLETQIKDQDVHGKRAEELVTKTRAELKATEEARQAVQTELDDLLIVLQDIEEKRTRDKKKLKELGAEVSDVEEDDEGEGSEGGGGDGDDADV